MNTKSSSEGHSKKTKTSTVASDSKTETNQTLISYSQGISSESNQRVIKKIVSLDASKLRGLGIESKILSAITKLNKTEEKTTSKTITNDFKQTPSTVKKSIEVSLISNIISQEHAGIASTSTTDSDTKRKCSPAKKVHVLSNVVLNENKWLDLKNISSAMSTTFQKADVLFGPSSDTVPTANFADQSKIVSAEAKTTVVADSNVNSGNSVSKAIQSDSISEADSISTIDTESSQSRETFSGFSLQQYDDSKNMLTVLREEKSPQETVIESSKSTKKQTIESIPQTTPETTITTGSTLNEETAKNIGKEVNSLYLDGREKDDAPAASEKIKSQGIKGQFYQFKFYSFS